MTSAELLILIKYWDLNDLTEEPSQTSKYDSLYKRIEFFAKKDWANYLPAGHFSFDSEYLTRLASWIGNVSNADDQKLLLEFAVQIAFFSQNDMWALQRAAFNGPITRWVIQQEQLKLNAHDFADRLNDELFKFTWFCPITDSMNINEFYHANHITGVKHRPGFSTLAMLDKARDGAGDLPNERFLSNVKNYIEHPDPAHSAPAFKRIVLLEDFVGSGTQAMSGIKWAVRNLDLAVLFVPLIACPLGVETIAQFEAQNSRFSFKPVMPLQPRDLLGPLRTVASEWAYAVQFEELARRLFSAVASPTHTDENQSPYTAFGYRQTGCSVVTYSNTPNNSLPLIHHRAPESWEPLFPRSSRI